MYVSAIYFSVLYGRMPLFCCSLHGMGGECLYSFILCMVWECASIMQFSVWYGCMYLLCSFLCYMGECLCSVVLIICTVWGVYASILLFSVWYGSVPLLCSFLYGMDACICYVVFCIIWENACVLLFAIWHV